MAYIANKPVRFDKDYAIGEIIPDSVIDPGVIHSLCETGRIVCVDIPNTVQKSAENGKQDNNEKNTDTQTAPKDDVRTLDNSSTDTSDNAAGEFVCEVCGKAFTAKKALTVHLKSHKE